MCGSNADGAPNLHWRRRNLLPATPGHSRPMPRLFARGFWKMLRPRIGSPLTLPQFDRLRALLFFEIRIRQVALPLEANLSAKEDRSWQSWTCIRSRWCAASASPSFRRCVSLESEHMLCRVVVRLTQVGHERGGMAVLHPEHELARCAAKGLTY